MLTNGIALVREGKMRIPLLALMFAVSGCNITPNEIPVATNTLSGNYQRIAACTYDRLASTAGRHNFKITNLQGIDKVVIIYDPQENFVQTPSNVLWEASFLKESDATTRVEIREAPSVFGDRHARFWPTVQSCAEQFPRS